MITLIHGTDTTQSRNYLQEVKTTSPDSITLDGSTLSLTTLMQALSSNGLFHDQKAIVIEELLTKRKAGKELDSMLAFLSASEAPIVLWESKEITKKQTGALTKVTVKQFSIPKTIFAFIEAIRPGNGKEAVMLFHTLLESEDATFALVMLQRQTRILLSLYEDAPSGISELSRLAPWQAGKMKKQALYFSKEQLLSLHENLFQLELSQKTGALSQTLPSAIDFLLLSI